MGIIYFIGAFIIGFIIYIIMNRTIVDKIYDDELNVNTRGLRSWGRNSIYYRTESTPYLALTKLIEEYKFNEDDKLIDFGSGKGRVSIYLHHEIKMPVTGIELNPLTYKEALANIDSYNKKFDNIDNLKVKKGYAEKYEVEDGDNKFFFFNPFDVSIFKKVVKNILKRKTGEIDIILYYPTEEYIKYIDSETSFELHKEIRVYRFIFPQEKFLIYRLSKK